MHDNPPVSDPSDNTQKNLEQLIDEYANGMVRRIFTKLLNHITKKEELNITPEELLLINNQVNLHKKSDEIVVESPAECIIGNGVKKMKVDLSIYQKMKERNLVSETKDSPKSLITDSVVSDSKPVSTGKNAYEIRLEVLKEAIGMADGNSDEALKIAQKLYSFVENRKR
jgi:uncharacterized protein YjhX (UPF0386 family)